MKNENQVEVGDFITYKDHFTMAVVAINDDKIFALCHENHKMAKFQPDDPNIKIVKKKGCKAIVDAIYSDLDFFKGGHK